jgi:endonuclease/exonuclease/phosphatase family metal-dependent hydrolase
MKGAARGAARIEAALWALAALCFLAASGLRLPLPAFELAPRASGTLRVVTWNVGGARDGEPHDLRTEHVAAVAATLLALEPDLILLQECGDEERLALLAAALGHGYTLARGRGGVAALSAHGELERWTPPLARSLGARLRLGGRTLALVTLHASAFSARDRNRDIGPTLEALLEQPADAHVLAGDLNLDLDLDKRGDLFSNDLHLDVETYNWVATRLADAARGRGPTAEPDRRLDYVFASPTLAVRTAGPWRGHRVGTMDHEPLVVDFAWP